MGETKAKIVLSYEVHKIIEYLTKNAKTEVGAVGTVKICSEKKDVEGREEVERYFLIDKLFFPEQEVTGATVTISPTGWNSIIKEVGADKTGDIGFYWHRHPNGSASHSGTDREDTFDVFMSPESGRKFFIFLQTSDGSDDKLLTESRIEMRSPVRMSIPDSEISLLYLTHPSTDLLESANFKKPLESLWKEFEKELKKSELTDDELTEAKEKFISKLNGFEQSFKIKKICEDALANKVKEKKWDSWKSNGWSQRTFDSREDTYGYNCGYQRCDDYRGKHYTHGITTKESENRTLDDKFENRFNVDNFGSYYDNSFIDDYPTAENEWVSIDTKNGNIVIRAGELFNKVLKNATSKDGTLFKYINSEHIKVVPSKDTFIWYLQPLKKSYFNLKDEVKKLFLDFNDRLIQKIKEEEAKESLVVMGLGNENTEVEKKPKVDYASFTLKDDPIATQYLLEEINTGFKVEWRADNTYGIVYEIESGKTIGSVMVNKDQTKISVYGNELLQFVDLLLGNEVMSDTDREVIVADKSPVRNEVKKHGRNFRLK